MFDVGAYFCFVCVPNKCLFDGFCKLMVRFVWVVYEGAGYLITQERHPRFDCMDAGSRATQESKPSGDPWILRLKAGLPRAGVTKVFKRKSAGLTLNDLEAFLIKTSLIVHKTLKNPQSASHIWHLELPSIKSHTLIGEGL